MYKDIITYSLAEGVSEEQLLKVAGRIVKDWMSQQPGFIKWVINKNSDQGYTDIVYWDSKEAAQKAEQEMVNIPDADEWRACYKEGTIESKSLNEVASFGKGDL
ncbi:hypothetical protein KC644_03860 [Candidatus Berkelbacteria bacterium]|nr:hypothetical protein [Candidatus Berkelbacteria bacterium]